MITGLMVREDTASLFGNSRLIGAADIMSCILPEDMLDEIPQGFTQVGHVCKSSQSFPISYSS